MNVHLDKVTQKKKKFMQESNENTAIELLREMRLIHGRAILDAEAYIKTLGNKGIDNVTDDELLQLSANESLLKIIQIFIDRCVNKAYKQKRGIDTSLATTDVDDKSLESTTKKQKKSDSKETAAVNSAEKKNTSATKSVSETAQNNNVVARITRNGTGTDELSLTNIQTETDFGANRANASDLFSEGPQNTYSAVNTSDYVRNLGTTEAQQLVSEHGKESATAQTGGGKEKDVTKPTVVYYSMEGATRDEGCKHCWDFKPVWEKFEKQAPNKFSNLQVLKFDVLRAKDGVKEAARIGVTGFPTVLLYYNGKTYNIPTQQSVEGINKSIESIITKSK